MKVEFLCFLHLLGGVVKRTIRLPPAVEETDLGVVVKSVQAIPLVEGDTRSTVPQRTIERG